MAANENEPQDENLLFREAVGDVHPLKQDRALPVRTRPAPLPEQSWRDAHAVMMELLSDRDLAELETGEELLYAHKGLRPTILRQLRRGHFAIEAELDLHGCRVPEAHAALVEFLREMRADGKRCIRIVHGKGLGSDGKIPVLKGKIGSWLRRRQEVLAYCPALPYDGGAGAMYVLLRKN